MTMPSVVAPQKLEASPYLIGHDKRHRRTEAAFVLVRGLGDTLIGFFRAIRSAEHVNSA
jgi:hypothetical protein